ncbi:cytochrome c-type biogenesis protein CcmF [Larkinella arboricola]|uniref:Cytochrome c-type biogenesis protein CcmF n=1 Tax=Larkinella arboricola TaxID=643671 RepID=A0A327X0D7_LARAB|nr:cytochrome c biogenesis protein CcsA [Larkinella arboricola]RAJ99787.1 cytochrome c-type biogenesis protein CcmF [Larkinella arboricola]
MIHTTVGQIGHLFVILSFVTALMATVAYLRISLAGNDLLQNKRELTQWRWLARGAFYVHGLTILGVVGSLFYIIFNNYYEYHYAWNYSSRALPAEYVISSFWHGQEGSFLLWLFWNAILGVVLIQTNRDDRTNGTRQWEAPMMTVFALVQAFLASMILGVVFGDTFKIGSSPFLLLREAMPDAPIFTSNPNYVPEDGKGMNPLLQNYWMVIHPPTLFLGYATTLIPFAFCIAGLWKNEPKEWMRPALPWALFSAMVLGVGILMGGYWAYETLNFGGYWNWDPVENSVLVPWLVLVAAIHAMLIGKKSSTGLKTAIILSVSSFLLILYSTFLTRSGILGNSSVHSFTDLGLSGQLLIYMLAFMAIAIVLIAAKWKLIEKDEEETSVYSKEFWVFIGAIVLCLASFQVLNTTSFPVYNKIGEAFGFNPNIAMPADQVAHFNKFQVWFFAVIAVLTGIGQYIWWRKTAKNNLNALITPAIISLVISGALIAYGNITKPAFMALLTASVFAIVANSSILIGVVRGNYKLSGGAVTHIGAALMLLGVLFSSGYSKIVSINNTGLLISKSEDFTKNDNKENKENVILWLNQPQKMSGYLLTYRGKRIEIRGVPDYVPRDWVEPLVGASPEFSYHGIALHDIEQNGKLYHKKGDTVALHPENTYYEVEYREPGGKVFTLFPRGQINEQMGEGGFLPSPDIRRMPGKDLYTYVATVPDPNSEGTWSPAETYRIAPRDTFFVNDYVAVFDNIEQTREIDGTPLGPNDAAVKAVVRVLDKEREYVLKPAFIIKDRLVGRKAETNDELGLRLQLDEIDPRTGLFTFSANTTQRDYIVMKAKEMPLINLLWIGTFVLVIGFSMAAVRRYREFTKMRDKDKKKPVVVAKQPTVNRI